MASTTQSVLGGMGLALLVGASLSGNARLERGLGYALAPLRVVAEVAAPLSWLSMRTARASEENFVALENADAKERQDLADAQDRFTTPQPQELKAGRSFLPAETVGRPQGRLDGLLLRCAPAGLKLVQPGMPVVSGDLYVGRIERVDHERQLAIARLVTERDFRVGAAMQAGAGAPQVESKARMVVGGLAESIKPTSNKIILAVRNASRTLKAGELLVVDEDFSGEEAFREQARGFELGRLQELDGSASEPEYGALPALDFRGGLYRVAIVGPEDCFVGSGMELSDVLLSEDWIAARSLTRGDPSSARASLKLALGERNGARIGAAVVFSSRMVGRVLRTSPLCVDVQLVGESGFCAPALAQVEGIAKPIELGRIVSLGWSSKQGTRVRFLADGLASRELQPELYAQDKALAATIFSGSGDPLVPAGLILGHTQLDPAREGVQFELDVGVDPRRISRAFVLVERPVRSAP